MTPHNNYPRFVTSFRCAGTKSFRLAAGKLFGEFGGNAQNPCKPLLGCLVAREGYSFVQPDQAGAEALIVAHLARPGTYRKLFACKVKPHTFLALHIFGVRKPRWFDSLPTVQSAFLETKDPEKLIAIPGWNEVNKRVADSDSEPDRPYYSGKRTAHARSYKMGARTFQEALLKDTQGTMVLSYKEAQSFLLTFDSLFPEIIEWQMEVVLQAKAGGELRNLLGFPRQCHQIFTDGYERELISWIPQSTVGCITHEGVLKLRAMKDREPRKYRQWHLVNNKHDSMLLEVPDCDVPDAAGTAKTLMAVDLVGRDGVQFRMKSDVQVGKIWRPAKKGIIDDGGMKEFSA